MNDVLPKPFTKDSLLGMLEKHLLHMKQMQMQQLGYPVPTPLKPQRLVELSPEEQHQQRQQNTASQPSSLPQSTSLEEGLSLEDPNLQFSYDTPDFAAVFGPAPTAISPFQQQSSTPSTGKRRTASDTDPYEYLDQSRTVPRSNGGEGRAPGKRARYNTPPW